MYNAFWQHALFLRGQSFSVKTFDRSHNGCQVIRLGAGNDFQGPSVQALPLLLTRPFFLVPSTSKRLLHRLMVNYACAFSQSELGKYFE